MEYRDFKLKIKSDIFTVWNSENTTFFLYMYA